MNKKKLLISIILTVVIVLIAGIELFFFQSGLIFKREDKKIDDESLMWQDYKNEELKIGFQYPLNWEEPKTKKEDYSNIIEYTKDIKYISISSVNQEKERVRKGVIREKAGREILDDYIKEAIEKIEREIEILEEVAKTGKINPDLKEEIKENHFNLISKSKDQKFVVEPVYLDNLNIWGIKLIGIDSPQISPCGFYYRTIFIVNEKIVKIYFEKIEAIFGYSCSLPNYQEFVDNFDNLIKEYKEALESGNLSNYNPKVSKDFEIYSKIIKSINLEKKAKAEEKWKRYEKKEYGIEFEYLEKYQTYSTGPDDRGQSGFTPSYDTIVFDDESENNSQMSVFWSYHKEINEKNYNDDYMIYASGLCDRNRGFIKELAWMDNFNNNRVLVVQGRKDNIPLNCYYFKNKGEKLVVFSLYNTKIEQMIRNLTFSEEEFKMEGIYREYSNKYGCLTGWITTRAKEEGPGEVSCVYTLNEDLGIINWAKVTKTGEDEYHAVDFYQAIDTPSRAFEISFDYIFPTKSGILTLTLDSVVIREVYSEESKIGHHYNFKTTIVDSSLFGLEYAILRFSFVGPDGSEILIGNVDIREHTN